MIVSHTPGPWQVDKCNPPRVVFKFAGGLHPIVTTRNPPGGYAYHDSRCALDLMAEANANARLIAAAPELLEALEKTPHIHTADCAMRVGDPESNCTCHVRLIRSAINKAKGTSS